MEKKYIFVYMIAGQKAKRTEIYKLQQQLTMKENQLQEMNRQKTVLLNEMESLKVKIIISILRIDLSATNCNGMVTRGGVGHNIHGHHRKGQLYYPI